MQTIRSLVDARAATQPHRIFLIAPEPPRKITYGELRSLCRAVAACLSGLGLNKGDKAAFLLDNGVWSAALLLGIPYSGCVVVPLNAVAGPEQLTYVLEHSDSKVLFVSDAYRAKFPELMAFAEKRMPIISTGEDEGPNQLMEGRDRGEPKIPEIDWNDEAVLIYTSGTTGRPKGALLTHLNAFAGGRNTAGAHGLTEQDRALCVLPLYHINGQMVTVMGPLVSGGSVVMPNRFSASRFWELIALYGCTWFSVVPTIIAYLLERAERGGQSAPPGGLERLRFGRSASAPLPPDLHRAFEERFGVRVVETMGLTETAAQILSNPMPPAPPRYGSPGLPYGIEAKIVDKHGRELGDGEIGELMIRGDNVMKGYYKNPEATREALEPDGWLHTGDLVYRDADGYFYVTGRLKEIIIKGGENIAPREIDEVLYQHPAVLEAAAFGMADRFYGQEVMACVALKPGACCSESELEAFCRARLGEYKAPKKVWVRESLPKGPSGKIQRLKLAGMLAGAPNTQNQARRVP